MRPVDVPAELLAIADQSTPGQPAEVIADILTEWERISAERDNGTLRPNGHWCDDACVCFIHDVPLYCNNATGQHACPMTTCPFAHGYESALRETYDRLSSDAATVEQFNVKINKLLGLPVGSPLDESLTMFHQQYNALRLALGQAVSSYGQLPGMPFVRDLLVSVVAAEDVDGWARTARYTRLAGDSSLTPTHSVSNVEDVTATPTKGNTMTDPSVYQTPSETAEVEVETPEQDPADGDSAETESTTADGE